MPANDTLREGVGTRITRTPDGRCVSMQGMTWHHPWFTAAYWWPAQQEWVALVRPGFVNGHAPSVLTTAGRMMATPSFLAPVTAWDGAADIAQAAQLAMEGEEYTDGNTKLYVPLYRNPLITLPWRTIDGVNVDIPQYFVRRGITPNGRRRLVSSDVVLHQPRLALTSQISIEDGVAYGISNVTQTLGLQSAPASDKLKVYGVGEFNPPDPYSNPGGLIGDYEEPTWDELLIARVFLVSPPDATGQPDGSWLPCVQHSLFWNMNYSTPGFEPLPGDPGVPFIPPLAGGMAQLVINYMTASLNDMTNEALNILIAHSMAGTFWTPTGGGSDSAFPESAPTPPPAFGLAKAARSAAERHAALVSGALTDTLDPVFPYHAMPFSLSLLN